MVLPAITIFTLRTHNISSCGSVRSHI